MNSKINHRRHLSFLNIFLILLFSAVKTRAAALTVTNTNDSGASGDLPVPAGYVP